MLINLIAPNNLVYYNVHIAKRFGLNAAVYLSVLLEINDKAISKQKIDDNGFFIVDRKYVESRSTLDKQQQKKLDEILSSVKVIMINENQNNSLKVDAELLASLLMNDDEHFIKDVRSATKVKKSEEKEAAKKSKREAVINNLSNYVNVDNFDLRLAFRDWICAIYDTNKINKNTVEDAQNKIELYTKRPDGSCDLNKAIRVLKIAASMSYKDVQWAIEKDIKNNSLNNVHSNIGEVQVFFDDYGV